MEIEEQTELKSIPGQLKAERTRLLELAEEMEAADRSIKTEQQNVSWDVAMSKDDTGALLFKNELQRAVETTRRLEEKDSYKLNRKTILNRAGEIERKKIDLQFLMDRFRMFEILSRLSESQ
jgi:hypothetical protein